MSCAEELRAIATALRKESPYFKSWDDDVLQAFIRDRGRCVYCGKPALAGKGCGDHLLPRKYTQWLSKPENRVAACVCCNLVKGNYDPSKGKSTEIVITEITDEVRESLIRAAREEIERRKIEWERDFVQHGKVPFEEAVAQYGKCKESGAAA